MRQFDTRHNELRKMAEMHNDLIDQNEYLAIQKKQENIKLALQK